MNLYSNIIQNLRKVSEKYGYFNPQVFHETLFKLSKKSSFIEFLNDILSSEKVIKEIISQSYLHQNGFDKIVLSSNFDLGWRLRLHIWDNFNDSSQEYDIHDHVWDYTSVIICGKLINNLYEKTAYGKLYYHHFYEIDDSNCQAILKYNSPTNLELINQSLYTPGEIYSQKKEVLHNAYPAKEYTVSLIIQEIGKSKTSNVYKDKIKEFSKEIGQNDLLISKTYLIDKLTFLIKFLNKK